MSATRLPRTMASNPAASRSSPEFIKGPCPLETALSTTIPAHLGPMAMATTTQGGISGSDTIPTKADSLPGRSVQFGT